MAKLTLAQQLAEIAQPAPKDFDPEDSYSTYAHERPSAAKDLDKARGDYVDVGESKLRRKGESVSDPKYGGRKASRSELFGGEDFEEADEDEDDDEDDDDDGSEEEEDEGDLDGRNAPLSPAPPLPPPAKKSRPSVRPSNATVDDETRTLVQQLTQAASADVDKGRDVKKQLAFCDNILEARIALQKAVLAINRLPQADLAAPYYAAVPDELEATLEEVHELSEELFGIRTELLEKNEKLDVSSLSSISSRKRTHSETFSDLHSLSTLTDPFLRATLQKWATKVGLSASSSLASSKKFKVVNPSPLLHIDSLFPPTSSTLPSETDRLVKRTRTDRSGAKVVGKSVLDGDAKADDDEVFDDSDFYAQLLRDVVESRMLDLDDPTLESLRLASGRAKKTKNVVDTRASKGRKIRYHVHEKLQNFMIPIPVVGAGGWHDEQVDELFASLLGRVAAAAGGVGTGEGAAGGGGGGEERKGSLRIFG